MADQTIDQLRGTVILADEVYPTAAGKWIIAGTYSTWQTDQPTLQFAKGLAIYVRFQTERIGRHQLTLTVNDASQPVAAPVQRVQADIDIRETKTPFEVGFNTTPLMLTPPPPGRDGYHRYHWVISAEVDGKLIASTPLTITFTSPPGGTHGNPGSAD